MNSNSSDGNERLIEAGNPDIYIDTGSRSWISSVVSALSGGAGAAGMFLCGDLFRDSLSGINTIFGDSYFLAAVSGVIGTAIGVIVGALVNISDGEKKGSRPIPMQMAENQMSVQYEDYEADYLEPQQPAPRMTASEPPQASDLSDGQQKSHQAWSSSDAMSDVDVREEKPIDNDRVDYAKYDNASAADSGAVPPPQQPAQDTGFVRPVPQPAYGVSQARSANNYIQQDANYYVPDGMYSPNGAQRSSNVYSSPNEDSTCALFIGANRDSGSGKNQRRAYLISTDRAFNERIYLPAGIFTIGRSGSCSLSIPVATVSGRHAIISMSNSGCTVTDNNSTNGTFVNGLRLAPNMPHQLHNGDCISFHKTTYEFHME